MVGAVVNKRERLVISLFRVVARFDLKVLLLLAMTLFTFQPVKAQATNEAPVIFSIQIQNEETSSCRRVSFSVHDLQRLPKKEFTTSTIWTSGEQEFTGVWMATLLEELGVRSGRIVMYASNDYQVETKVEDFMSGGALLAYARNGELLLPRNKGPLWLVYNYDSDSRFRSEAIYSKSIWQLDRMLIIH